MAGAPSPLDVPLHPDLGVWLIAAEGFFATLTKRRLKRGVFRSVAELQAAINRSSTVTTPNRSRFHWVADPVRRGHQTLKFDPLGSPSDSRHNRGKFV